VTDNSVKQIDDDTSHRGKSKNSHSGNISSILKKILQEQIANEHRYHEHFVLNEQQNGVLCKTCVSFMANNRDWREKINDQFLFPDTSTKGTLSHLCTPNGLSEPNKLRNKLKKHISSSLHGLSTGTVQQARVISSDSNSIQKMFCQESHHQFFSWLQKTKMLYSLVHRKIPLSTNASYFDTLLKMLQTPGFAEAKFQNARYDSYFFYREMLQLIAVVLSEDIQKDVEKCNYFSIVVDETEDKPSHKSQLAVLIRFFNFQTKCSDIRLLGIVPVKSKTGETVHTIIGKLLDVYGIPPFKMFGFGSDGASAMMANNDDPANKAVSSRLLSIIPWLSCHHCLAHKLNLAIIAAAKNVAFIEDKFLPQLTNTHFYFASSPNATAQFIDTQQALNEMCGEESAKAVQIKHGTHTRWLSMTAGLQSIINTMPHNLIQLKFNITRSKSTPERRTNSKNLFDFWSTWQSLKCLFFMNEVHHHLSQLSRYLQNSSLLFTEAYTGINIIIAQVQAWAKIENRQVVADINSCVSSNVNVNTIPKMVDENMSHQLNFEENLIKMKKIWELAGYQSIQIQNPRIRTYRRCITQSELHERKSIQENVKKMLETAKKEQKADEAARLQALLIATTDSIENKQASSRSGRLYNVPKTQLQQRLNEQFVAEAQIYSTVGHNKKKHTKAGSQNETAPASTSTSTLSSSTTSKSTHATAKKREMNKEKLKIVATSASKKQKCDVEDEDYANEKDGFQSA
jgi:hypothetical protein